MAENTSSVRNGSKYNMEFFCLLKNSGKKCVIEWCMKQGLISNHYTCPTCKKQMRLVERKDLGDGYDWVCRTDCINAHHVKRSLRKGSWFERSPFSLIDILMLTYLWLKEATAAFISHELNISPTSVSMWKSFCREICVESCINGYTKLGGPGIVVEVDEIKFGTKVAGCGNWVFGCIERGSKKCMFEIFEETNSKELLNFVEKYVLPGSTIVSDCWKSYQKVDEQGFDCLTTINDLKIIDANAENHSIHCLHSKSVIDLWKYIKLKHKKQKNKESNNQFNLFLYEFMWRRSHGTDYQDLFPSFLAAIAKTFPSQTCDNPE